LKSKNTISNQVCDIPVKSQDAFCDIMSQSVKSSWKYIKAQLTQEIKLSEESISQVEYFFIKGEVIQISFIFLAS
jgi:hypothetical protein